ncbi:DUF3726 domain-containing protein [Hoeflea sp. TYP-13]|uniref:DUF3726 domain-containing protein n=1 Tax=Hoeflea sp. TYP-13 TaxID=3230023 RepID=UPI0034C65AF4
MSTVVRSLNEVYTMLRKAAIGAGCSHGIAEELGRAGVWLCTAGQNGVGAVLSATQAANVRLNAPTIDGDGAVFHHGCAATAGPAAMDLLLSKTDIRRVRIEDVDVPLLVAGLAGIRAAESNRAVLVEVDGAAKSLAACDFERLKHATAITFVLGTGQLSSGADTGVSAAEVDAAAWSDCEKLAARTYVPATEQSRVRGAGANITDND